MQSTTPPLGRAFRWVPSSCRKFCALAADDSVFASNSRVEQLFNCFYVLLIPLSSSFTWTDPFPRRSGRQRKRTAPPGPTPFLSPVRYSGLRRFDKFVNHLVFVLTSSILLFVFDNSAPIKSGQQEELPIRSTIPPDQLLLKLFSGALFGFMQF